MNRLTQFGLQSLGKVAIITAVGSTSKTCSIWYHQPKVSQSLKKQLEEKKNN